ncbi:MAG: hypothetical protein EAX96_12720 [Candidatus Lokiarchaeota archaeon]|nr:hypothetical protein [Candidatus Lokiarchaeota archaeon]
MSSKDPLFLIEKQRYLIPCKCKICKKGFQDIMICQRHIFEEHSDREQRNIIDNMVWNVDDDAKKYAILQDLEEHRNLILKKLNDLNEIEKAEIPSKIKIRKTEYELKAFVDSLKSENKPSNDVINAYQKDLKKQCNRFLNTIKDIAMSKEVENTLKKKQTEIDSISSEIDMYLSIKKVIDIIEEQK